jgi:hypothetical protein
MYHVGAVKRSEAWAMAPDWSKDGPSSYLEFLVRPEYGRLQDDVMDRRFMKLLLDCPIFVFALCIRHIDTLADSCQSYHPHVGA